MPTSLPTSRHVVYLKDSSVTREALLPMLHQGTPNQRLLAAYGLAVAPGEKPQELMDTLKNIFVQGLRGEDAGGHLDASYTYRAADGLGLLGADAKDAVPALLEYAGTVQGRGNSSYLQHALLAVCRIEPGLSKQYPEIEALLQQERAAREKELASGQGSRQEPPAPPVLTALVLEARLLLLESGNSSESELSALVEQWDAYYRGNPGESALTTERFRELSASLAQIDTNFNARWVGRVLRNYPGLDRIIQPVTR